MYSNYSKYIIELKLVDAAPSLDYSKAKRFVQVVIYDSPREAQRILSPAPCPSGCHLCLSSTAVKRQPQHTLVLMNMLPLLHGSLNPQAVVKGMVVYSTINHLDPSWTNYCAVTCFKNFQIFEFLRTDTATAHDIDARAILEQVMIIHDHHEEVITMAPRWVSQVHPWLPRGHGHVTTMEPTQQLLSDDWWKIIAITAITCSRHRQKLQKNNAFPQNP